MIMYWDMAKRSFFFFFFSPGRDDGDRRVEEESRGNRILLCSAVPSCKNRVEINLQCQERLNKLVIGWKVFVCVLSHFCCSVVCFLQGYT